MLRSIETIDPLRVDARRSSSASTEKRIIASGPQTNATARRRVELGPRDQAGDHADLPGPAPARDVDGHVDLELARAAHVGELRPGRAAARAPASVEQRSRAVAVPVREHLVDDRAHRRQSDAARDDHDVGARGRLDGPVAAERPADPEHRARLRAQIASVAAPTARTVWTSGPGFAGSPLIEIGTSPAPNA